MLTLPSLRHPSPARSRLRGFIAVLVTVTVVVTGAGPAWAAPFPTPTTTTVPATTTIPPLTLPPHGPGPNPAPGATTSTSTPAPTTTVDPRLVSALVRDVQHDLARLDAITGYDVDKGIVTVNQANSANADSDADLAAAAEAQAAATATATREELNGAVHRLSALAVALYVRSDLGAGTMAADPEGNASANRSVVLGILINHGQDNVAAARRQLRAAEAGLRDAQQRARSARATQAGAHQTLSKSAEQLTNAKLAAAGRAVLPTTGTPLPTIMGPVALSAGELAGWFTTKGFAANTTVAMPDLAGYYVTAGTAAGLRGDIAFAQSIVETGYFSFPSGGQLLGSDNNFAGIGACDTCAHGWRFPTAQTGVAAQVQLLQAYASPKKIPTPLVGKVSVAGCCSTWLALTGVWATASNYGYVILTVYKEILDWVIPQRVAAAGL